MERPAGATEKEGRVYNSRGELIEILDWLKHKRDKAVTDHAFANGYRAGLECAIDAIERGRDILDYSIDDGKADIR